MFDATHDPARGAPLEAADLELVAAAEAVLRRHYRPFWHTVAAALRARDGRIWTGMHLGATVGRLAICAEAVAFGRAVLEGDGTIATAVAMRHPKPEEDDQHLAIVPPCGACRELITDYSPEAWVIVPGDGAGFVERAIKVPVRSLLPVPYRR